MRRLLKYIDPMMGSIFMGYFYLFICDYVQFPLYAYTLMGLVSALLIYFLRWMKEIDDRLRYIKVTPYKNDTDTFKLLAKYKNSAMGWSVMTFLLSFLGRYFSIQAWPFVYIYIIVSTAAGLTFLRFYINRWEADQV